MANYREQISVNPSSLTYSSELNNLKDKVQTGIQVNLVLDGAFDLDGFVLWAAGLPPKSLGKLSLNISTEQLKQETFLSLFKTLKTIKPEVVELNFGQSLDNNSEEIEKRLSEEVAPLVDFPVQIKNKTLIKFQNAMIQSLQKKPSQASSQQISSVESEADVQDPNGKKIRLKALVQSPSNTQKTEYNQLVSIDLENVEVVEQNVEVEEEVQINQQVDHQIANYSGELVDFTRFNFDTYRSIAEKHFSSAQINEAYTLAQHELFANLPFSIKYLTPAAAKKLAANLPHWVAMNKENCSPFVIKQTLHGEYVLDFELDIDNDKEPPFSLHEFHPYDDPKPYYQLEIKSPGQDVTDTLLRGQNTQPLINLWLRHGDEGLKDFTARLKNLDTKHADLSKFLFDHYLGHFAHLEPFYNESFFEVLSKLQNYSTTQMSCLKRFLVNTGSSQHSLAKTLESFDLFWHKFKALCKEDQNLMEKIDANWSTPKGGQPAIYMERLLSILEKARSLPDQLKSLDGILLNQYGAHYASRYEGFTEVHKAMDFDYNPNAKFNFSQFNPNFTLYRVDIERLKSEAIKSSEMLGHTVMQPVWLIKSRGRKKKLHSDNYYSYYTEKNVVETIPHEQLDKITFRDYMNNMENVSPEEFNLYTRGSRYDRATGKIIENETVTELTYNDKPALPMTAKDYAKLVHRFIGQQVTGITVQAFADDYQLIINNNQGNTITTTFINDGRFAYKPTRSRSIFDGHFQLQLLQTLFFITSDRYSGRTELSSAERNWDSKKYDKQVAIFTQNTFSALLDGSYDILTEHNIQRVNNLQQLWEHHVNFNDQEAYYYQISQDLKEHDLNMKASEKLDFFYRRVKEAQEDRAKKYEVGPEFSWWKDAQTNYKQLISNRLINNKYSAFKFLNLVGPILLKEKRVFLYAFNTEDFFAEIPQVAQVFRDDLLAFSAQLWNEELNLIPSDAKNALKTKDKDIEQLKQIRTYVSKAAQGDLTKNYFHYTIKLLIDSGELFTYDKVLTVFGQIQALEDQNKELSPEAVQAILTANQIEVKFKAVEILKQTNQELKYSFIGLIILLELGPPNPLNEQSIKEFEGKAAPLFEALKDKDLVALQEQYKITLAKCNIAIRLLVKANIAKVMKAFLDQQIIHAIPSSSGFKAEFTESWRQWIAQLKDLSDCEDLEAVDKATDKVKPLGPQYIAMLKNPCILQQEATFLGLFKTLKFNELESEQIYHLFNFLSQMPQRNFLPLLEVMLKGSAIIYQKKAFTTLLRILDKLSSAQFSNAALEGFCKLYTEYPAEVDNQYDIFISQIIKHNTENNKDPLVELFLISPNFNLKQIIAISAETSEFKLHREVLAGFYKELQRQKSLDSFLNSDLDLQKKPLILKIISLAYSGRRSKDPEIELINVVQQLQHLEQNQLEALSKQYDSTLVSISCLSNALNSHTKEVSFTEFLLKLEKSPFGLRNLEEQFSTQEVERVVNGSLDLLNNTPYPYQYRKQLLETFLLINDLGNVLPVYHNKPANDLSNIEIQELFALLKTKNSPYTLTQKRVLALTIMREAMYRSTGQFPFSTQMIGLIDCMLHKGDVIANIDTGQGKSLIDVMKAAFLWLESDRVELSTSSLFDAARDIENYGPFLHLLNIPFAKKPIDANTPLADISLNGINFTTISQWGLRLSKALASEENLETPNQRVSLVLNESDHALLDDRSVKRLASTSALNIAKKNPWVYDAINAFVTSDTFKKDDTTSEQDIRRLRRFLVSQAKLLGKRITFLNQIDNESLLTWIESAILVNYNLQENVNFVVMPIPEKEGKFVAKILMDDGRLSPDSVFGKGIQQLLHAKLNNDPRYKKLAGEEPAFEITPENRTIISSDNRSLINYYRAKKGFIWGSSGTTGSQKELEEQYAKYGFVFSKIEPHQKKQVVEKSLVILKDKNEQLEFLAKQLQNKRTEKKQAPTLIFCDSIDKAKEIFADMVKRLGPENIQLSLGTNEASAEKALIKNAAAPGMCTITTAAIGRNTDIPYDKNIGLDVWFTDVASTRLDLQKLGRTGRQGSPGEIAYYLNQQDQNISSKADIQLLREKSDDQGKKERDYHETLYLIIGSLLAKLEKTPSNEFTTMSKREFIYNQWSKFSEDLEQNYRELYLKKELNNDVFAQLATDTFRGLLKKAAPGYVLPEFNLNTKQLKRQKYSPYSAIVKIQDCTNSIDIAYQLFHQRLNLQEQIDLKKEEEGILQAELQTIFSSRGKPVHHQSFFNRILESKASAKSLRTIYQSFLKDFLSANKPSWFFMRWLGFNTPLKNIADDQQYLVLFRAMASLDPKNPVLEVEDIKSLAINMIEEYLQNSWWIGKEKREAAIQLQASIKTSDNLDAVIKQICDSQVAIAEKDIQLNKNYFGNSRLQNTLSQILTMATALGVKTNSPELVSNLTQKLEMTTQEKLEQSPTQDIAKNKIASSKGNARVLAKSLERALGLDEHRYKNLPGMEGRDEDEAPLSPNAGG